MNSTALRAEVQSTNNTHMVFANKEHENGYLLKSKSGFSKACLKKSKKQLFLSRYYEKLEQARYQDCYHKALIHDNRKLRSILSIVCILGISEDTRNHFSQIYDMKSGCIKTGCLQQGWQISSVRAVRLAFNLYMDPTPGADDYEGRDGQMGGCREYSVSDIFCCGYAAYFLECIKLLSSEYCQKRKPIEEIFAAAGCRASGSRGIRQMRVQAPALGSLLAEMEGKYAENSTDGDEK